MLLDMGNIVAGAVLSLVVCRKAGDGWVLGLYGKSPGAMRTQGLWA